MDTSALIAILAREHEAGRFVDVILQSDDAQVGAPTVVEYLMVAAGMRLGFSMERATRLLSELGVGTVAFTPPMVQLAFDAAARFGKGRHPARLNFGDCMAYALARSLDAPLLFKGTDFGLTDVKVAVV